jgi:hypothetical protein
VGRPMSCCAMSFRSCRLRSGPKPVALISPTVSSSVLLCLFSPTNPLRAPHGPARRLAPVKPGHKEKKFQGLWNGSTERLA